MESAPPVPVEGAQPTDPSTSSQAPPMTPTIAGSVEFKYYQSPEGEGFKRLRAKRKVAIVFGYVGERYCGLQWNHLPEYPTVEEALMKALYETDMISLTNFSQAKVQQLLNFERASRTDKGVHALRNVVSVCVMLPYDPTYVERRRAIDAGAAVAEESAKNNTSEATSSAEVVSSSNGKEQEKKQQACRSGEEGEDGDQMYSCEEAKRLLNLALPSDIHVYSVVPVTRSFNSYHYCGGRKYEYYLPTYALMTREQYTQEYFPASLAPSHPTLKDVGYLPGKGTGQLQHKGNKKKKGPVGEQKEGGGSGRKSKGHFPKSKKRRMEDARRREEERTAMAQGEAEEDSDEDEGEEQVDTAAQVEEGIEGEASAETGTVDEFLESHAATHFRDGLFETMILFRSIPEDAMEKATGYRLSTEQLANVREMFKQYEGTHCYHNFTPGGSSTDASCHRYIRSVTVSDPFIVRADDPLVEEAVNLWSPTRFYAPDEGVAEAYAARALEVCGSPGEGGVSGDNATAASSAPSGKKQDFAGALSYTAEQEQQLRADMRTHMQRVYGSTGIEVVRVELDGQSFMLNQIRKMIGAVVCMAASGEEPRLIGDVLLRKGERRGIPMAPANGLFLSYLDFSGYNQRLQRIQSNGNNGRNKDGLHMDDMDTSELEEQRRRIVAVVLRNEMAEDLMGKWMRSLRHVLRLAWKTDLP